MRFRRVSLAVLLASACFVPGVFAQREIPQIDTEDVTRVGSHIACQCGSCKESMNCAMAKRGCGFCNPAKAKVAEMQKAGLSDKAIIDTFVKEYGSKIYLDDPSAFYWIIPYGGLAIGMLAIIWFLRRYYRQPQTATAGPSPMPELDSRYREQIEKETARLD